MSELTLAAGVLADEITRRRAELHVLEQAHAILVAANVTAPEETTAEEPAPAPADLPVAELQPPPADIIIAAPITSVADVPPASPPGPPRTLSRPSRPRRNTQGNGRVLVPSTMAQATNSMQFMRAWANTHGGVVNVEDMAGVMYKRKDLNPDRINVEGLVKLLASRLSVTKEFTRTDKNVYRWEKFQATPAAATGNARSRPNGRECPAEGCDGTRRLVYASDNAGNREKVWRCFACGREEIADPAQ